MKKTYEKKSVKFWHGGGGKWWFQTPVPNDSGRLFTKIIKLCDGPGRDVAAAVATAINAGFVRACKMKTPPDTPIDGLCRYSLSAIMGGNVNQKNKKRR